MGNLSFTCNDFTLSFDDTGRCGFTLEHNTGYKLVSGSVISKMYPTTGSEAQPQVVTSTDTGYRITYTTQAAANFSVIPTNVGIKLNLVSCNPDDATAAGCGRVELLRVSGAEFILAGNSPRDMPVVRLPGGFVLALLPITDSTAMFVRASSAGKYMLPASPDPTGKFRSLGLSERSRGEGIYIIFCPESEFTAKLEAAEIELGIRTPTLGGSLAKVHQYNNQDYLFLLDNKDSNGVKLTDSKLISFCNRMGFKQVMFAAWLWYDNKSIETPFSLVPGIVTTVSKLKAAGISTIAHSYVRPLNPDITGSWWSNHKASIVKEGNCYYADVRTDLIEKFAPLYAQAVMAAGFDGIYWDGLIDYVNVIPGEIEGRTFRSMYQRFYQDNYYPKVVQSGCNGIYSYISRSGQTDLWEGASEPRLQSVDAFIDLFDDDAIRNIYNTPDLGWWGTIHSTTASGGWRYATKKEWIKMATKSFVKNIPIGYRTTYALHMADPDRLFVEELIKGAIKARVSPPTSSSSFYATFEFLEAAIRQMY